MAYRGMVTIVMTGTKMIMMVPEGRIITGNHQAGIPGVILPVKEDSLL